MSNALNRTYLKQAPSTPCLGEYVKKPHRISGPKADKRRGEGVPEERQNLPNTFEFVSISGRITFEFVSISGKNTFEFVSISGKNTFEFVRMQKKNIR